MSRISRRQLTLGASAAALGAPFFGLSNEARGQAYPSQDVHFICAFAAGSGADVIVRFMAERLRPSFGRPIIVENKPGAVGNIATEYVARSKPDGHTIYVHGGSSLAANMHLFKTPSVDVATAFEMTGTIMRQPVLLVVAADGPYKSAQDLTAAVKQKGNKASYATAFATARVAGALYKAHAKLDTVEVSYRTSAEWLNDLGSGAVDYAMVDTALGLAQMRTGRLRIVAVSTKGRVAALADVPTMTELGYPMDIAGWWAGFVPAATPAPIVEQLRTWFDEAVAKEESKKFFRDIGGDAWTLTPAEARAYFLEEIRNWGEYVRIAKIEQQG
jgi:tripartite-type tricarboxylate transporter receptor subunit TctC